MMKTKRTLLMLCVLIWVLSAVLPISASSMTIQEEWEIEKNTYTNPETGFKALIADEVKCLSQEENDSLRESMKPLTQYGNIGCCIVEQNIVDDASDLARMQRNIRFKKEKYASILLILVPKRTNNEYTSSKGSVFLHCEGDLNRFFSQRKKEEICNSVYQDETKETVYSAAAEVLRQVNEHAAEKAPIERQRYFSYGLIALVLGLTFAITLSFLTDYNSSIHRSEDRDIIPSQKSHLEISKVRLISRNTLQQSKPE